MTDSTEDIGEHSSNSVNNEVDGATVGQSVQSGSIHGDVHSSMRHNIIAGGNVDKSRRIKIGIGGTFAALLLASSGTIGYQIGRSENLSTTPPVNPPGIATNSPASTSQAKSVTQTVDIINSDTTCDTNLPNSCTKQISQGRIELKISLADPTVDPGVCSLSADDGTVNATATITVVNKSAVSEVGGLPFEGVKVVGNALLYGIPKEGSTTNCRLLKSGSDDLYLGPQSRQQESASYILAGIPKNSIAGNGIQVTVDGIDFAPATGTKRHTVKTVELKY